MRKSQKAGFEVTLASRTGGGSYGYVAGNWYASLLDFGPTLFSVYYYGEDFVSSGSESTGWGAGLVQNFDKLNLDFFLGRRVYSFKDYADTRYETPPLSSPTCGTSLGADSGTS